MIGARPSVRRRRCVDVIDSIDRSTSTDRRRRRTDGRRATRAHAIAAEPGSSVRPFGGLRGGSEPDDRRIGVHASVDRRMHEGSSVADRRSVGRSIVDVCIRRREESSEDVALAAFLDKVRLSTSSSTSMSIASVDRARRVSTDGRTVEPRPRFSRRSRSRGTSRRVDPRRDSIRARSRRVVPLERATIDRELHRPSATSRTTSHERIPRSRSSSRDLDDRGSRIEARRARGSLENRASRRRRARL